MFDFGWQEFMMIAFVLVLVVGPNLPKVLPAFQKSPAITPDGARIHPQSGRCDRRQ